jgi:hypothetical protein
MKRMTAFAMIAAILLPCVMAEEVTDNKNFRGQVNFDAPCIWSIQGTKVTSSAAELNLTDGLTATTDELNAVADASGRATTATVADNGTVTLSASTPFVVITGTGQTINTSCDIVFAQSFPNQTLFTIMCAYGSTNYIRFSNTTAQVIGDTVTLEPGQAIQLYSQATNKLCRANGANPATMTDVTTISNATLKVYGLTLEIASGGTVTLPAASIASTALPATIANSTMFSNLNANIVGSNLVVTTGGTVILPSAAISSAALPASIVNTTTFSNQNAFVYGSNITARSGGTATLSGTVVLGGLPTSTNTFSVSGTAWNSNGYVCVWTP